MDHLINKSKQWLAAGKGRLAGTVHALNADFELIHTIIGPIVFSQVLIMYSYMFFFAQGKCRVCIVFVHGCSKKISTIPFTLQYSYFTLGFYVNFFQLYKN